MNTTTWSSGELQPLVAEISITTTNIKKKKSFLFFHLAFRASVDSVTFYMV